ncbi:hypothetical protein D3C73_1564810 [compost metagenome]
MACLPRLNNGLATNTQIATMQGYSAGLWDRIVAAYAKQERMRRQYGLGGVACSEGLIKTLLHQVIRKISDISQGRYPAISD